MTKDEAQRSIRPFYEAARYGEGGFRQHGRYTLKETAHNDERGGRTMGKDKDVKKENKKKPSKTLKEKKEAKRLKKSGKAGA